ncbi:hypothetical protein GQ457_06G011070 [Hibiscus cannabinus]
MNFNSDASVLLFLTLAILILFLCILLFMVQTLMAQSSTRDVAARALDALLHDYAYMAFVRPKTGVLYDGIVPSNLPIIQIATIRLRNGSLRNRGVKMYRVPDSYQSCRATLC